MHGPSHILAGLLLGGLLLTSPAGAQDKAPAADARVRIFGQNGQGITMYTNAACREAYDSRVDSVRSSNLVLNTLIKGAPANISLGMPKTEAVRNMKSVLFSRPSYEEYSVAGGQPLIFDARIANTNDYRCSGPLTLQFTPEPGNDYEIQMSIVDRVCRFGVRRVSADGSVQPEAITLPPDRCEAPTPAQAPPPTPAIAGSIPAAAGAPAAASGPPRDWTATVQIVAGLDPSQQDGHEGALPLRLVTRGRIRGTQAGALALAYFGNGKLQRFAKNSPRGSSIDTLPSPALTDMPGALRTQLADYFRNHPDTVPYEPRTVQTLAGDWTLAYVEDSGDESQYELTHNATVGFRLSDDGAKQTAITCNDRRLAPLPDWQADDYAKVRSASQEFAQRCAARFARQLPSLFPVVTAPTLEAHADVAPE